MLILNKATLTDYVLLEPNVVLRYVHGRRLVVEARNTRLLRGGSDNTMFPSII